MENTELIRFFEVKLDDSEKKKELLKDVNINKIYLNHEKFINKCEEIIQSLNL